MCPPLRRAEAHGPNHRCFSNSSTRARKLTPNPSLEPTRRRAQRAHTSNGQRSLTKSAVGRKRK